VVRPRTALAALAPFALHALAREVDHALGLVLRAELEPAGLLRQLARALAAEGPAAPARVLAWMAAGALVWILLAARRAHAASPRRSVHARLFGPLYLRPLITLLALVAVGLRPSYPYGFTLPVALTQDWGIGQDLAALAVLMAIHVPVPRLPAPRAAEVFLISFLGYALLVPGWARVWEGHPGNEPKYLRQAVALGHGLTFDAEGVSAAMEDLPTQPLGAALRGAITAAARESGRMAIAVARGEAGRDAIRAARITRQTIRGKEGGVYYVLAPGPSLLLAPALRADRALNLARGTKGRLAVSVLLWCVLAALLVAAVFTLLRDTTGRPGLAAALGFGFALVPPFLFYFFQFYPEMPGALVLTIACAMLVRRPDDEGGSALPRPEPLLRHPWLFGGLIAILPWLHQKFLPAWAVLVVTACALVCWRLGRGAEREVEAEAVMLDRKRVVRVLLAIAVPQALTLYLTALYSFAVTGSVRPDALFLAWGPGGVTSARVGQGVLGLLLDARYGILPYVPVLALAAAGLLDRRARALAVVLPSALVYYLTVASADNWAGAVCNLGRYFMPIAPLAVVLVGLALTGRGRSGRAGGSPPSSDAVAGDDAHCRQAGGLTRGAVALALVLAAWTGVLAVALWQDPHAANDSALLLAKSTYADGHQYIPDLFVRRWSDAAPGLWARIAAWLVAVALVAWGVRRASSPLRVLIGLALAVLALGFVLERWPGRRTEPAFGNALPVGSGTLVFFEGAVRVKGDEATLGPGAVAVVRRTYARAGEGAAAPPLRVILGGMGLLRASGLPPLLLRPSGGVVDLPLLAYHVVDGRDGRAAVFSRLSASVSGQAVLRFGEGERAPLDPAGRFSPTAPDEDVEPDGPGLR
jgi:hypothetical protein